VGQTRGWCTGLALALLIPLTSVGSTDAAASPATPAAIATPTSAAATVTTADLAPEPDLARLRTELADAQRQATEATEAARAAAGRAVGAQIVRQQASVEVGRARDLLQRDVRRTLTAGPVEQMPGWVFGPDPNSAGLLRELRERSVTRRTAQVGGLRTAVTRLDDAGRTFAAQRDEATRQAGSAVLAADHARRLLDDAVRVHATNLAVQAQLDAQKRALDALNAQLLRAVAPVQTTSSPPAGNSSGTLPEAVDALPDGSRPDSSASAQAAILKVLESSSPSAVPPGYRGTGQILQGESSWYGPGFIGSPTSSGVPYDPERLTCAMLAVPLGTVVRVSTPAGASVNLLVNDHGPYVGNRIMDVSMRANRILNLGLGQVRIEVLQRTG
jgi:rare lipoprotein A (peptidoglycan hydrolase)